MNPFSVTWSLGTMVTGSDRPVTPVRLAIKRGRVSNNEGEGKNNKHRHEHSACPQAKAGPRRISAGRRSLTGWAIIPVNRLAGGRWSRRTCSISHVDDIGKTGQKLQFPLYRSAAGLLGLAPDRVSSVVAFLMSSAIGFNKWAPHGLNYARCEAPYQPNEEH